MQGRGYCECGCGELAPISPYSDPARGYVKGEPRRFVAGHFVIANSRGLLKRNMPRGAPDECWEWQGRRSAKGYGRGPHNEPAHRFAYRMLVGRIPNGMLVCHHCDNPPCCNPAHLFVGTHADNMDDMVAKGRQAKHQRPTTMPAETVALIRDRYAAGESQGALAAEYGTTPGRVGAIVRWETRKEAGGAPVQPRGDRGERHAHAKLTDGQAQALRAEYEAGGVTFKQLAERYGVSREQARRIGRGVQRV